MPFVNLYAKKITLTEKTGKERKLRITKNVRPTYFCVDGNYHSPASKMTDIPED
jgi:hypothetical protein